MRDRLFLLWIIVPALLLSTGIQAQDQPDSASLNDTLRNRVNQWKQYNAHHNPSPLYLQTDKDVYIPNSNLLFTAYLFQGDHDTSAQHILYVELADPVKKKPVATDRFAMKDFVGSGSLFLPDTLAPGPYLLIAYTNALLDGKAQEPFRKMIHIRSPGGHPFVLAVSSMAAQPDSLRLKARVTTQYGGLATGGLFSYTLGAPGNTLQSGTQKINAFGEVNLALPAADSLLTEVLLTAQVKRDGLSADFWMPVSLDGERWNISYYPEGGNLVNGHTCRIGIQIRNSVGKAVSATGILMESGIPVTTFSTDAYGLGQLTFTPDKQKKYTVRMKEMPSGGSINGNFPDIQQEGYTLTIPDGIVRDSLNIHIGSPQSGSACMLMMYNDQEVYYASTFRLSSNEGIMSLPVDSLIRGVVTITLYDDKGLPVAERAVYFPGPPLTVDITPDSLQYQTGSKITLHVKVTDREGRGVPAIFSLASVLTGRVAPETEDSAMDLLLLTKYWTRYQWTKIGSDTTRREQIPHPADYGYVLYRNRPPDRPLGLILMGAGGMQTLTTDSVGHFQLTPSLLISPQYGHTLLAVAEQNDHDRYELKLLNEYDSVNNALARAWFYPPAIPAAPADPAIPANPPAPADGSIPAGSSTAADPEGIPNDKEFNALKTLKTIVIKGVEDHYSGDATCNDYVCPYNVLNCMNHPYGRRPVVGQSYLYAEYLGGPFYNTIYRGCVSPRTASRFLKEVVAIHLAKDIYRPDDKGNNAPGLETPYNSTLFWSPLTATDKNGEATLIFYSQQLPGRFVNTVRGLSVKGPVDGKSTFRIVSPAD